MDRGPADPMVGKTIGQYEIVSRIGGGGMGLVYAARDTRLSRRVALKFLPPQWSHDESAKQRFVREAQTASATDHPNICTIHDIATTDDGQLFIVMAHYDGETLKDRLERGPVAVDEAIDIAAQVAEGLARAHAPGRDTQGVVHRDIKPGNLMLTENGLKILDFGLAKFADARLKLTLEGSTLGTVAYMSPEQVRGEEADARSDIWATGVVLYEMLSGQVPFKGGYPEAIAHAIKNDPPPPLRAGRPDISESLEQIVFRALHKEPAVRYQHARDLARALRRLQGRTLPLDLRTEPLPVQRDATPPVVASRMWWHTRTARAVAGTALVVAFAAAATWVPGAWVPGAWMPWTREQPALPDNRNVAVFPFEVVNGTPEDLAWATGLSALLSAALTQATGTASQIAPTPQADQRVGESSTLRARNELGATLVLSGSVERADGSVRVVSRLIDTATSQELRTSDFTERSSDPAALHSRLVDTALEMLDVELPEPERRRLVPRDTAVAAATDLYLQGRGHLQYFERWESIDGAIAAFTDALKLEPKYAKAYAGLGEAYWRRTRAGRGQSASDAQYDAAKEPAWTESALANCSRALVLDPRLAEAHVCLGRIHHGRGRYEEAAVEFQRAIDANPTIVEAYTGLANAEARLGRLDQAEATHRRAIALRSRDWIAYNELGLFYAVQARYADAAQMFAQVVSLAPDGFRGYSNLGGVYVQLGRYDEAVAALERSVSIRPTPSSTSNLGTAYFSRARFADAARMFEQAVKLVSTNYELWGNLADAYYWAPNERSRAQDAYRRAVALGAPQLKVNPRDAALVIKLAYYRAMLDEPSEARDLVARALEMTPRDAYVLFRAAVTVNKLGETDRALGLLERAREAGYSMTIIRDTPDLSNLWSFPRFQSLIRGQ